MPSTVTRDIAAFAAALDFGALPDTVVARGKIHILDALGLGLAGAGSDVARMLRDQIADLGPGRAQATVIGTETRLAPRFAALINGTAMLADNFDDTCPQESPDRNGGIHATVPVLAAALALAEAAGRDGRALMAAYHAGVEIACRLNHAIAARHYEDGFHSTGTLSVFGATAAAGRLMGLEADELTHALAGAASRAAGIRRNFGTMVEVTHAGRAAEDGVSAADLAARGLTGAVDALEGTAGYFEAGGGGYLDDALTGRLGAPWAFDDPGMWIKPFPNGALTHPGMTALLALMSDRGLAPGDVARLRVRTNKRIHATLAHHRPATALEAKFSMPFALAILLLDGEAGLGAFTDAAVVRVDIRDLIDRIDFAPFERAEPGYTNVTTLLEVERHDGTVLHGRADHALGSAASPMSYDDVAAKFQTSAAHANWPADKARAIVDTVGRLERVDDLSELTGALALGA